MKKILLISLLTLALCGCGRKTIIGVSFPEAPIQFATNADFGMELINYYNIIQLPDGTYRMYFSGNPIDGIAENERAQNLYLAESTDGFHYELKCKVMDMVIEQSVFMVKDKEYPYRMVGCQWIGEKSWQRGVFLWKSKDGIEFTDRKMLYDTIHDTQNVMVTRGNRWKLYSRITQEHYKNRRMTVAEFNKRGEQLSDTEILAGDFLYNNAACKVDKRYDLLFPTYYNTHGGTTDACFFRCYLTDGPFIREFPCELNRWVEADEHWVLASPGFVFINGERYLAYNSRTRSHETSETGMVSRYKLVKAVIEYE
ncbi:MAG: hypothetical protein IJQ22_03225 [Bacteroidales bacterium]|nr:hypothetical protein [Bacteroidales bacterium]